MYKLSVVARYKLGSCPKHTLYAEEAKQESTDSQKKLLRLSVPSKMKC